MRTDPTAASPTKTVAVDDKTKSSTKVSRGGGKETGVGLDAGYNESYWTAYGQELEVEKEIKEIGVEKIESGEVAVPEQLAKQMGIEKPVSPETPISPPKGFSVGGVSLNDDQLTSGKKVPVNKSFRWLIEWFIYELLKAKYLVKIIKGQVARFKKE